MVIADKVVFLRGITRDKNNRNSSRGSGYFYHAKFNRQATPGGGHLIDKNPSDGAGLPEKAEFSFWAL